MNKPQRRLIPCGVFLGLVCATSVFGQGVPDPSLALHFDFEGDLSTGAVLDKSGHNNNGILFNATNSLRATNGVFGSQAAQFSYVGYLSNDLPHVYSFSQYLGVTNLTGFAYLTNGTISLWARFDTNVDRGMYLLDCGYSVTYAGEGASNSWTLGRLNFPYLSFGVYTANGALNQAVRWPDDTVRSSGSSPNLSTTQFHLYTVTIDCPGDQAIAYYDGAPYMTNNLGVPWLRVFGSKTIRWLCIGAMAHNGTPQWGDDRYPNAAYFVGRMDDVRIYNRTLSAPEVQALYFGSGILAQSPTVQASALAGQNLQLCWQSQSNANYQVEWRSGLSGGWLPLGTPMTGSGGTDCLSDSTSNEVSRFYRVRPVP